MTEHIVVDTVSTSAFRTRLSHHLGRVRHGGHCLAVERKNEEPVYVISAADFALLGTRVAEIEDGPQDPVTKRRRGGIMAFLRRESRVDALNARIEARRVAQAAWAAEREAEALAAEAVEPAHLPKTEGWEEVNDLIDSAMARLGKRFEDPEGD